MTLRQFMPAIAAALAIFACTPETVPSQQDHKQQEQADTTETPSPGPDVQTEDPRVEADEAGNITETSASLYGSFAKSPVKPDEIGFVWGTSDTDLSRTVLSESVVGNNVGMFNAKLDNLSPGTVYYFSAFIKLTVDGASKVFRSAVYSFKTEGESSGSGGGEEHTNEVSQPGWFELPQMDIAVKDDKYMVNADDNTMYYAWHLCPDVYGPVSGVKARNYTVCYSAEHHCPLWVAAPRHSMYAVRNTDRTDAYQVDPDVPKDLQYKNKSTGGDCNKGHMLGSEERRVSRATNVQVFYYTNIAPQLSANFNTGGGRWNVLEDYVESMVCKDTLYETLGCYFEPYTDAYGQRQTPTTISFGGRNDVTRPTMFYYILLRTKSGNSGKTISECTRDELQCVAFVRSHVNVRQEVTRNELMSVSDLEKITGFTYFANVPQAPKDSYNPSDWNL